MPRPETGRRRARRPRRELALACTLGLAVVQAAAAQQAGDAGTRAGVIAAAEQKKTTELRPYGPNRAEVLVKKVEEQFITGSMRWHPWFESAYAGGGFTVGAGYVTPIGSYNSFDLRASYTLSGYKRVEGEFRAPRLFDRRGTLSVVGGWREATQVGFYGLGTSATSKDDRANYSFRQPYASATLDVRPTRKHLVLTGGAEYSRWQQRPGDGTAPSVEEIYTPATLAGLGKQVTYLHALGGAAFDWRTSPGYSRRGGYYGIIGHSYSDTDSLYSFRQVDYEAIQHIPVLRDAFVLSLHGRVQTTYTDGSDTIPFFMLPSLGGGSSLRGFPSWRFRDRHSVLLQAEWRVLVNSFFDAAVFYDAGKVTDRLSEIDFDGLKKDYGIGLRLHGPAATPLRIELAKSNEGLAVVFSASSAF
jgi:outer membrane protein assembly factor BamA